MAQHDYVIDNQSAPSFRSDLNNAMAAIVSQNSGASAPATTFGNMLWYDTANNQLKKRNEADSAWITLGTLDESGGKFNPNATGYSLSNVIYLTSGTSATYTPPSGARALRVTLVGGGGGAGGVDGQGSGTYAGGGAGGAGQIVLLFIPTLESSYTYTVGAGGSGGAAGANAGGTGGSTVFAGATSTATAGGGGSGVGATGATSGAAGTNSPGSTSVSGFSNYLIVPRPEPNFTRWISGLPVVYSQGSSGSYGAVVPNGSSGAAGPDAYGYGAGGSGGAAFGTTSNYAGGSGSGGLIIIEELF